MQNRYFFIIATLSILISIHCSDNNLIIQEINTAEKMYYKAGKIQRDILIHHSTVASEDYREAENAYRLLINKYSNKINDSIEIKKIVQKSWLALAELMLLQKNYDGAIGIYQEIIEKSSADKELLGVAQYSMATCLGKSDRIEDAIEAYKRLVKKFPPVFSDSLLPNLKILQTPILIARLYQKIGKDSLANRQYGEAQKYYQRIIQQWPNSAVALAAQNQMAMAYGDIGRWGKSVEILNDIIIKYANSPGLLNIMFSLGNIYHNKLQQPQKAMLIYKQILDKYPQNRNLGKIYLTLGRTYMDLKYYEKAREMFRHMIKKYPKDYNSCLQSQLSIAKSYELDNNWHKALNEYQWAIENYPRSLQALDLLLYIADYYRDHQKENLAIVAYENAIKRYKLAIEQFPETKFATIAHDYMATSYMRLEKWQEASDILQSMLKMKLNVTQHIETQLALGNICETKLKNEQKAIEIYSDLLEKFPQIPIAQSIISKKRALQRELAQYKRINKPPVESTIISTSRVEESSIEVKWTQNKGNDFYSYKLIRSDSPGVDPSDLVVTEIFNKDLVNYIDNNLQENNTYYYRLYTFDKGGLYSASNEVSVKLQKQIILTAVRLQAQCNSWTSIALTWNQSDEKDFDCYKIYRSRSPKVSLASELVKSIFDKSQKYFIDTDLKEKTTYYYKVYVFNTKGFNKPGNEVEITTPANTPPAAVTLEPPSPVNNSTIQLKWTCSNEDDFSMYRIYRSNRSPVTINNTPLQLNSNKLINYYKDTDLTPGNIYYYKIVVYDKGGLFSESNEVSIKL